MSTGTGEMVPGPAPRPFHEVLHDETGAVSSRRVMFFASGFSLCLALVAQAVSPWEFTPDENLVDALMVICIACGGLASLDKFTARRAPKGGGDA